MKSYFSTTVLFVCFLFSLSNLSAQTNKAQMMKKLEEWNKKFSAATVAGDNKTILSFYADDAYSLPSYSPMIIGKKAIADGMRMNENSGMKMKHFALKTKDFWISGDMMFEIGTYELSMTIPGQEDPMNDHGKYITIYQKQKDGSWKIKADMWNTDLNPWAVTKQ